MLTLPTPQEERAAKRRRAAPAAAPAGGGSGLFAFLPQPVHSELGSGNDGFGGGGGKVRSLLALAVALRCLTRPLAA